MNQTIKLDAKKREGSFCKERIYPLRRGERNNVTLTVAVRRDRRPYDLAGMTAHLVWQAADGKLVGPVPMEVTDQAAGTVRCTLPDACYAAVGTARAYIEIRNGEELVDTTDEMSIEVLDCIDADGEQAEEYKPLIGEVREATDAAIKAAAKAVTDTQAAIAEVKATEAKLYPVAENILVRSETGAVAHVEDAFSGASLRKITVEGACKQDGIPSPDAPKPITVVENPVVKVTGRNLFDASKIEVNTSAPYGLSISVEDDCIIVQGTASGIDDSNANPSFTLGWYADNSLSGKGLSIRIFGAPSSVRAYGLRTADETQIAIATSIRNGDKVNWKAQIAVSKGESEEYKPYTSQTLTFTLPAEHPYLAKLPDGTADEIVVDEEGNVELVARVARVLPSEQKIVFVQGGDDFASYVSLTFANDSESQKRLMISAYEAAEWTAKSGYIYCPQKTSIVIRDNRFTSEAQARELLNGVVVYIAVEPTRYPLGKIEMPKAQDSIVNAWTDAEVTPNTGIGYVRDVNIVVANLEAAIASITEG